MEMIAAEMCEVLNPMLALNKLTVFSNSRQGGGRHSVTDNVIAADTTKYRNPLDKVLPSELEEIEADQEKLKSTQESSSPEDEDRSRSRSTSQPNNSGEPVLASEYEKGQSGDCLNVSLNLDRPSSCSKQSSNVEVNEPICLTTKTKFVHESKADGEIMRKLHRNIAGKDATTIAETSDHNISLQEAIDTVNPDAQETLTEIKSSELPVSASTAKVTGRYSRSPRRATESPSRSKARPRKVTLVKQNSSFGGALCCSKKTKTFQVTRHMSPMTPERDRQSRLVNRRKQNSSIPNISEQQQQQQKQRDGFHLSINPPEITADPASSSTHMTSISDTNASSVVLLPLFPPVLQTSIKDKPSSGYGRATRDLSPSYSPTQFFERSARSVASYFSSTSTSPVSLDDSTSRHRTKSPAAIIQHTSKKNQSPSFSMFSNDESVSLGQPKSTNTRYNLRRTNSTDTPGTSGSEKGSSTTLTKKIYQSGGKRCLSPNKSPHEPRKFQVPSFPSNLTPTSSRRLLPGKGSITASPPIEKAQNIRKNAIARGNSEA